ncbi:hypothetical protein FRC12_004604 [Ceratobasidium sp. 428]|nr:hypothetical protein FRC12_004604 [Ceratobasidium sp. 428]
MVKSQEFWVSHLKFARLKAPHDSEPGVPGTQNRPPGTQLQDSANASSSTFGGQSSSTNTAPKPYERIAADRPGQELAPDAAIWQMYVEEAQEHDSELVDSKNKNLDMMLLFATLFSAILTAFIIESKNLLQQDSADLTVTLLLAIAQSQQRIELGTHQTSPSIERPSFSAPMSARWINGLWYTSLALSLSAALVAMLAKEWLGSFVTARPRAPRPYAFLHQAKIQGLIQWKALHIIDILPAMLHISLLLFSLGLVAYLWTLDSGTAIAVVIVTVTTVTFYLGTALLGASIEACPFDTQISKYLRMILNKISPSRWSLYNHMHPQDSMSSDSVADDKVHALTWLAENARDPAVGDCAYQALAGLKIPQTLVMESNQLPEANNDPDQARPLVLNFSWRLICLPSTVMRLIRPPGDPTKSSLARHTTLSRICDTICTRILDSRHRQYRELETCSGVNVARYASALPTLVHCLEAYIRTNPHISRNRPSDSLELFKSPIQSAFAALDSIWHNDCPEFHPDSYAILAAAELRLIRVTMLNHYSRRGLSATQTTPQLHEVLSSSSTHASILVNEVLSDQPTARTESTENNNLVEIPSLFKLRARYSRTLFRVGICLSFHNNGRAPISSYSLVHLLESVNETLRCEHLDPTCGLSTHHPQLEGYADVLPNFHVHVIGTGSYRYLRWMALFDEDGLIAGIIGILAAADIEATPWVEYAAGQALTTAGPMLIRQWLGTVMDGGFLCMKYTC